MSKVEIREISIADWEQYKQVRLRSLRESPDAFGSTYDQESKFTNAQWIERVSVGSRVSQAFPLIAEVDGEGVGLACGIVHLASENSAKIYQMWVDPICRGQGIGKLLLKNVINWAKSMKLNSIELAVTTTNIAAVNLYLSCGFVAKGKLEPLRPGSSLYAQHMVLNLRARK